MRIPGLILSGEGHVKNFRQSCQDLGPTNVSLATGV